MPVPSDATEGRKLTFEQCLRHIGGAERFISEDGREMIDYNRKDYLWKFPERAFCTYCGADVGDFKAKHNSLVTCPACGREVLFKHESRGHQKIFDEFCLYEWRKSALDPQTVTLTATFVWRDSTKRAPHQEPLHVAPQAIYIFRPGRAATVWKRDYFNGKDRITAREWSPRDHVAPAHTEYRGGRMDIVVSRTQMREALEGTRIGATYGLLEPCANEWHTLELTAIANCAKRPWLEYLYKSGQPALAARLMRMNAVPREIIPNQRARDPRRLLGITESQWREIRLGHITLTAELLECMGALRRMGLGEMHMAEIMSIVAGAADPTYQLDCVAPPARHGRGYRTETVCEILSRAGVSTKLTRKACRRIFKDLQRAHEWRDYYIQLRRLGEDLTDTALLLPRDMPEMHRRMIERENALLRATEARRRREMELKARKRLRELSREYSFDACGLTLRPYETAEEIIRDGQRLHICIGGYVDRYFRGDTIICCLRRAEEPDESWRAVEFSPRTGRRVQDRGEHNDTRGGIPPGTQKQLKRFWAAFERHRAAAAKKARANA